MTLAVLLVAFLAVVVLLLLRSGELKTWQVVMVAVLGIYLDRLHVTEPVVYVITWLAQGLTHTS